MIFHVANAWQETKDVVKLFACCFEDVSSPPKPAVCCLELSCGILIANACIVGQNSKA